MLIDYHPHRADDRWWARLAFGLVTVAALSMPPVLAIALMASPEFEARVRAERDKAATGAMTASHAAASARRGR